jgi:NADH:ubiquinone oxidoreductase subunit C
VKHISGITGHDNGKDIELLYHFSHGGVLLSIKTRIDRKKPAMKSIVKQFPGAEIYERECFEMLGISFQGNPRLRRILLGHESPVTPLRKDAKGAGGDG